MSETPEIDWDFLKQVRAGFLESPEGIPDYWRKPGALESYEATFGARIGWKWDAVLSELSLRGWSPRGGRVVDWGCGPGIASQRLRAHWPSFAWEEACFYDRSLKAAHHAARRWSEMEGKGEGGIQPSRTRVLKENELESACDGALVLVSHVWNELRERDRRKALEQWSRAAAIVWVEPGSRAESRDLQGAREVFLEDGFGVVAPCTHWSRCGLLAEGQERHWCHHFAKAPTEAFVSSFWSEFTRRMGVDLRALPYSFLALDRQWTGEEDRAQAEPDWMREIGRSFPMKGKRVVLTCCEEGVDEREVWKRDEPKWFKMMEEGKMIGIFQGEVEGQRLKEMRHFSEK